LHIVFKLIQYLINGYGSRQRNIKLGIILGKTALLLAVLGILAFMGCRRVDFSPPSSLPLSGYQALEPHDIYLVYLNDPAFAAQFDNRLVSFINVQLQGSSLSDIEHYFTLDSGHVRIDAPDRSRFQDAGVGDIVNIWGRCQGFNGSYILVADCTVVVVQGRMTGPVARFTTTQPDY
jgi:hypothetical protein